MWFNQFCATNSYSIVMWLMSITVFLNYSCNIQVIKSLNHHNHGENPVLEELSEISSQVKRASTKVWNDLYKYVYFIIAVFDQFCNNN